MITIEHTHATGTVVRGATRHDGTGPVFTAVPDTWRFSRKIGVEGAWYLPHSRDRDALHPVIERLAAALRAAGHEVQISIDNTPRPPADTEADRAARVAARVTRYTELATARHASGTARLARVDQRRAAVPLGQPVIDERYANFVTRLNQAEDAARAEMATGEHWQRRARSATSTQWYRYQPRATARRVERLVAELRRWQRARTSTSSDRTGEEAGGASPEVAGADTHIARLTEQLDYWRGVLAALEAAGVFRMWAPADFRPGDEAKVLGTWYPVVRVNTKSLTVELLTRDDETQPTRRGGRTSTAPYGNVYGRRRDGTELHSPPPAEDATCTCRITIPTSNPEAISERDDGPCTQPPVARLTIRHDGTTCGCDGTCMLGGPEAPDTDVAPERTEVVLFCANHADEYQADVAAAAATGAAIFEDLS